MAWQIDTHNVPFRSQLIVNWCLTTISYPLLIILILLAVKDGDKVDEEKADPALKPSAPPAI